MPLSNFIAAKAPDQIVTDQSWTNRRMKDLERNNYMLGQGTNDGPVWSDTDSGDASGPDSGGSW